MSPVLVRARLALCCLLNLQVRTFAWGLNATVPCCSIAVTPRAELSKCETLCALRPAQSDSQCLTLTSLDKSSDCKVSSKNHGQTTCVHLSGFPKSSTSYGSWFVTKLVDAACASSRNCTIARAVGLPPYERQAWNTSDYTGSEAVLATFSAKRAVLFTQLCSKHAPVQLAEWDLVNVITPLRDPREYAFSRDRWNKQDSTTSARSAFSSVSAKINALRSAFNNAEARLRKLERGDHKAGLLYYLKDSLELKPEIVANQVIEFLSLGVLLNGETDAVVANAIKRTLPFSKVDSHALKVKEPATDLIFRADTLRDWYGATAWAQVEEFWAQKEKENSLVTAFFPWSRIGALSS